MRHANKNRTLSRSRDQRTALIRGLAVSLIRDGQIKTTLAKAKELQPRVERLVTFAKKGDIQARRAVASRLGVTQTASVAKLFSEIAPRFKDRKGGYTRIVKLGHTSPGREEAIISFVE
ncbi:MAG: 50S ribosomal protein L17 [Patescibacteria group bacterium]